MVAAAIGRDEFVGRFTQEQRPHCRRRVDAAHETHAELRRLVDVCRAIDGPLLEHDLERVQSEACLACVHRLEPACQRPLNCLLPVAVAAVGVVQERRRILEARLVWPDAEMPETD